MLLLFQLRLLLLLQELLPIPSWRISHCSQDREAPRKAPRVRVSVCLSILEISFQESGGARSDVLQPELPAAEGDRSKDTYLRVHTPVMLSLSLLPDVLTEEIQSGVKYRISTFVQPAKVNLIMAVFFPNQHTLTHRFFFLKASDDAFSCSLIRSASPSTVTLPHRF